MNAGNRHANTRLYEFGAFRLDSAERVFARSNGERIPLAPKAFDTLLILVQHGGRVVKKDELLRTLWPDTFVEENNLNQHISALRRALGKDPGEYIETVPKLGYRFVGKVREIEETSPEFAGAETSETFISRRTRTRIVLREEIEEEEDTPTESVPFVDEISNRARAIPDRSDLAHSPIRLVSIVTAAIVLGALALLGWRVIRLQTVHTGVAAGNLVRLTSDDGLTLSPALSRDGRFVAYASDRKGRGNLDIWIQPVNGGAPLRLTQDATDDSAPDFSPDGQTIVYRSERDGGGVYAVSVHAGEARLIAANGRRPKFSPDGKWIAYWVGEETGDNTGNFMVPGAGKVFIVSSSGGPPKAIQPHFAAAGYPIWTPDARHLLFLGNRDPNLYNEGAVDWWVAAIDGGEAARTGASAAFQKTGFASASQVPDAWTADGTSVLTSAALADTRNIWQVPISTKDWKIAGEPQRLTYGTGTDSQPTIAGSRLVFSSLTAKLEIWSLPIYANHAKSLGAPKRLTEDADGHGYPAVSMDGTKIAFSLQRGGNRQIWMEDLTTDKLALVSRSGFPAFNPNFSPDGKELIYRTYEDRTAVAYEVSLSGNDRQPICENCSDYGWSSDKKRLALVGASPAGISILELATKKRTALLRDPEYQLWNARFSPDDHWISFNATEPGRSRIFITPATGLTLVPREDWIAIPSDGWDDKPRWSPDGNTLYFVSDRDGFRCIWAQRLDSKKHPLGDPIPVFHAHESSRSMSRVGPGDLSISVARDQIVFNMSERNGNLWLTSLDAQH
ncbi:MAG TPA: winged helix-turn-helix domain-containing protein [Terracidiphilus sp.]|nr:winged helix-turn-helix domain-containing protein [Terracidiphilus sp.]